MQGNTGSGPAQQPHRIGAAGKGSVEEVAAGEELVEEVVAGEGSVEEVARAA
jgi:hypothetical protein